MFTVSLKRYICKSKSDKWPDKSIMLNKKFTLFCILFIGSVLQLYATHQRAAEITYEWINGLTYQVTITMYTYTPSPADDTRSTLPIIWGDNTSSDIPRVVFTALADNYTLNIYKMHHTFPAAGSYKISVEDPNRNLGLVNVPNSVNVPMFTETQLVINPFLGNNNSVTLLNPPIDQGCVGSIFVHNPAAFDPDGDSLSFKLVACRGLGGLEIPGFTLPLTSNIFAIDSITGDLVWDAPVLQGEYNIAFIVEEWRFGMRIGYVTRDMQIVIGACSNTAPVINCVNDTCVIAGETLNFQVSATDPDGNGVTLTANGGPFEGSQPAHINPDPAVGMPTATTNFIWETECDHIRKSPFVALFRARDANPIVSLTSLKSVSIKVIAPAVTFISAVALGDGANLDWEKSVCNNALGYKIYRRSGSSTFVPDPCQTGVSGASGYRFITQIQGINELQFRDDDNGAGLVQGISYCYVVTAYFQDGAESIISNELCVSLKRDLPVITHVSNDSLALSTGHVITAWSKPTELDTNQFPGPYFYKLIRYEGITGTNGVEVFTGTGLNDTLFTDPSVNLNSTGFPYVYAVRLESGSAGSIGSSQRASSIFLNIEPTDGKLILKWNPKVPWINDSVMIYRKTGVENSFSLVGKSKTNSYTDVNLTNEQLYCYYLKTVGGYSVSGIIHPIINYSQIACATPVDNIAPCPLIIGVTTDCEKVENLLHWNPLPDSCGNDVMKYLIYYKPNEQTDFTLIDSVFNSNDTTYLHREMDFTIGCYYMLAVDEPGNISLPSNTVCVDFDACPPYELPNVFTPNGDLYNDIFRPIGYPAANPKAIIESVKLTIFNRWGNIMFETTDPEINWDGKNSQTGSDCPAAVYFYTCEVYYLSLNQVKTIHLQGSVTIIR